jgi:hypothetical protein
LGIYRGLRDDVREQERGKRSKVDLHGPLNPLFQWSTTVAVILPRIS